MDGRHRTDMQNTKRPLLKKAFRIIRRNYGCPGNDGVSISKVKASYEKYENIVWQGLEKDTYVFEREPKRVTISDYLCKKREVFVYNVAERWIQEILKLQIEPAIEVVLAEYIYAFRRGKSDTDSYKYILKDSPKFILRTDIEDYFGSINKEKLFANMEELGLAGSTVDLIKRSLEHCARGLPSGHVLSCILSNFNLKNFDSTFPKNYTRYSDDMMFGLQTKEEAQETLERVGELLGAYNFKLNLAKTKIIMNPTLGKIQ